MPMTKGMFVAILLLLLFVTRQVSCFQQYGNELRVVSSIQRRRQNVQNSFMANEAVLVSKPSPPSPSSSSLMPPLRSQYRVLSILMPTCLFVLWGKDQLLRLPSLLLVAKIFDILRSAARRRRLDATTFKFLNMGSFISFGYLAASLIADAKSALMLNSTKKGVLKAATAFGTLSSGGALIKYGLPSMKIKGSNVLSLSYMTCAALAVHTGMDFATFRSISDPIQAFLFPAVFFALSGAAIVGDKRLASDTYKGLNLTVLMIMIARLGMDRTNLVSIASQHQNGYFFTIMATLSCLVGFYKGASFERNGPMLLKVFDKD